MLRRAAGDSEGGARETGPAPIVAALAARSDVMTRDLSFGDARRSRRLVIVPARRAGLERPRVIPCVPSGAFGGRRVEIAADFQRTIPMGEMAEAANGGRASKQISLHL